MNKIKTKRKFQCNNNWMKILKKKQEKKINKYKKKMNKQIVIPKLRFYSFTYKFFYKKKIIKFELTIGSR